MRKVTILFIVLAALVSACSDEINDVPEGAYLTIQGETIIEPTTRIVYNDEGLPTPYSYLNEGIVSVAFEQGEVVEFMFAQGATYKKALGSVTELISSGFVATSKATIRVNVPEGIDKTQPFNLYSVLAGKKDSNNKGSYIDNNKPLVSQKIDVDGAPGLRYNSWLNEIEVADQIIQVASVKNVQYDSTPGAVNHVSLRYKHLGALIAVAIKNDESNTKELVINGLRLEDTDTPAAKWIYDTDAKYNLETDKWVRSTGGANAPTSHYAILFYVPNSGTGDRNLKIIPVGKTIPTYRWIVPTGELPSKLKIRLSEGNADWNSSSHQFYSPVGTTDNTLVPEAGKRYRMNRKWKRDGNTYILTTP